MPIDMQMEGKTFVVNGGVKPSLGLVPALVAVKVLPFLDSCELLPNQQCWLLVGEVRHITHDFLSCGGQCRLEILQAVEVQQRLNGVWARIHGLVWLRNALDLADRVTLEIIWAELFRNQWHVLGDVVIYVESRVGGVGVQDCDLSWCHRE